jgi:hypothetical protein
MQSPPKSFAPERVVYSGREKLGTFQRCGTQYIAWDRRGRVIGRRIATATEAVNAVANAALEQERASSSWDLHKEIADVD